MIKLKKYSFQASSRFKLKVKYLEIPDASRFFIVGPSGSGKTTLMKSLAGLHDHYQGALQIDGVTIADYGLSALYKSRIVFLTQELGLWPHLNAMQHISFVLSEGASLKCDEASYWLDFVGLENKLDNKPHELSGGEQKRLALARALSAKPKFLFLDEPFANIDPVLAGELMNKIDREHEKQKFSLVKVTHHYLGLNDEKTNIIVINDGEIIQQGTWQEISQNPKDEWTKQWVGLAT